MDPRGIKPRLERPIATPARGSKESPEGQMLGESACSSLSKRSLNNTAEIAILVHRESNPIKFLIGNFFLNDF